MLRSQSIYLYPCTFEMVSLKTGNRKPCFYIGWSDWWWNQNRANWQPAESGSLLQRGVLQTSWDHQHRLIQINCNVLAICVHKLYTSLHQPVWEWLQTRGCLETTSHRINWSPSGWGCRTSLGDLLVAATTWNQLPNAIINLILPSSPKGIAVRVSS